jgi:serine/threonine-protein kinase
MGVVLRGHDGRLNRELAVKVLHPQLRDATAVVRRFTDEAQIAGQLQHPGIVPVHDLGVLPDGRPFFTMKLVKGRTLADLLAERPDPAHDRPRFLKVFEQVCQTMAYAHSRHVIHRDLKPSNVMVGAFGEVLVMDWGIAKVLGKSEPAPDPAPGALPVTEVHTGRDDTPQLGTQAGDVLGTYAYMAPEQARGQVERLDERCDVFGLGAILCEILTGRPPYTAATLEEIRVQALVADQAAALERLGHVGADAELVALARACLAADPERRPRDAGAVAAAVTAYLAGVQERLRQMEVDRTAAQVKAAEVRKRRRINLALAAAVLAALLAGGVLYVRAERQRQQRQEQTALLVSQALGRAEALREQARALRDQPGRTEGLWRDALAAAGQAEQALAGGAADAATRERVEGLTAELRAEAAEADNDRRMLRRLEEARDLQMELQESDYVRQRRVQEFVFGLAAAPAYAAAFRAYGIDVEQLPTAEAAARIRQRPIRPQLATALEDWYFIDPQAAGGRLLEVARAADPDPLRDEVRLAVEQKDGPALKQLADHDGILDLPVPTLILLADVLRQQGLRAEAVELLKRAQQRHPADFWVNDVLGLHLTFADPPDYAGAARCYAAAIAVRPNSPVSWANLGTLLTRQGHLDAAMPLLREGVRVKPDFMTSYEQLCHCLLYKGDTDQALAVVQEALRRRPDSPLMLTVLGEVQYAQGKREEAAATFQQVLDRHPEWVRARLALAQVLSELGKGPKALDLLEQARHSHPELSLVHEAYGSVYWNLGDVEKALAGYRKAVELLPGDPGGWANLGRALSVKGNHEEALEAHRRAVAAAPGNARFRVALAYSLRLKGALEEAARECQRALDLDRDCVPAYRELGNVRFAQRKYTEAADALREAVRRQPLAAQLHAELALALYWGRDFRAAEDAAHDAIEIDPHCAEGYNVLGLVYVAENRLDEAIIEHQQAIQCRRPSAMLYYNLGNAYLRQQKEAEAEDAYRQASALDRRMAEPRIALGMFLLRKGKAAAAEEELRQAVALARTNAVAHIFLSEALQKQDKFDDALAAAGAAVRLQPANARAYFQLGEVLLARGEFAEALVAFQQARRLHRPADDLLGPLPWDQRVRDGTRCLELDVLLGAVQAGKLKVLDAAELAALGRFCREHKRLPRAAAQFYADAFATDPKLAADPRAGHGASAARAAALAAASRGADAARLPDEERAALRRQALGWLRGELAGWARLVSAEPKERAAAEEALRRWQADGDLAGIREPEELARLPREEREAFAALWDEVKSLLEP